MTSPAQPAERAWRVAISWTAATDANPVRGGAVVMAVHAPSLAEALAWATAILKEKVGPLLVESERVGT